MVGGGRLQGSIRWAFNTKAWDPTEQDWLLASRCIPVGDKERINKFVFKADAKASMAGCLMSRTLACLATGEPNNKIVIQREQYGRPSLLSENVSVNFNVSHQGHYTVLAGEIGNDNIVGVDVMSFKRKTGSALSEFFRLMGKTCSVDEWNTILALDSDEKKLFRFFRHWCLKESYMKGIGTGVRGDMRHISFKLGTPELSIDNPASDTVLEIDRVRCLDWAFHECLLDTQHCVAVALSTGPNSAFSNCNPIPFSVLSWEDIIKDLQPMLPPDEPSARIFTEKEESGRSHEER